MIRSAYGSPVPAPPGIDELSPHFPGLEIIALVGRGGAGAVYRAIQKDLGRVIALKVLLLDPANDPAFGERFAREARAMARLNHPNIASVHDAGRAGPFWFLTMEFIDGANLRQVLRQGRLTAADGLDFTRQICAALEYAHGVGVVHRDIKPENVLVDELGVVKLVDFGLAKLVGGASDAVSLTGASQAMGTWHYMAPEQLSRPREVDHRADIFSLGVVLYELLTGEVPQGRYAPLSSRANVDRRLDDVVDRTLEQDPDLRYQHVRGMGEDLDSIGRGESTPLHAAPATPDQGPSAGPNTGPESAQAAGLTYRQQRKLQKAEHRAQRGCVHQVLSLLVWGSLAFIVLSILPFLFFGARSIEPEMVPDARQLTGPELTREIEEPQIVAQILHRLALQGKTSPLLKVTVHRLAMDYLIAEEGAVTMTRVEGNDRSWLQIDIAAFETEVMRLEDELLSVVEEQLGAAERAAVARRFGVQSPFRFGRSKCSFEYVRTPVASLRELGGRQDRKGDAIRARLPLHVRRRLLDRTLPQLVISEEISAWADALDTPFRTANSIARMQASYSDIWDWMRRASSKRELESPWVAVYVWDPSDVRNGILNSVRMIPYRSGVPKMLHHEFFQGKELVPAFTVYLHESGAGVTQEGPQSNDLPDESEAQALGQRELKWIQRVDSR